MRLPSALEVTDIRTFAGTHLLELHDRLTVIVGSNNSGKTSLLRAIFGLSSGGIQGLRRTSNGVASLRFPLTGVEMQRMWPHLPSHASSNGLEFPSNWEGMWLESCGDGIGRICWADQGLLFSNRIMGRIFQNVESRKDWGGEQPELPAVLALTAEPMASGIALWTHGQEAVTHPKRMSGTELSDVQRSMLFLRLRNSGYFDKLERIITSEFPEFRRIAFEDNAKANDYLPRLQLNSNASVELGQSSFGAGAWVFICVLTAALVAHATGARLLLLDEPTLFMHPQLERRLLRELSQLGADTDDRMRLVIATHSPILVDAAFAVGGLRVVDWRDRTRGEAQIVMIPSRAATLAGARPGDNIFALTTSVAEILYAETILFLEGPSDVETVSILAEGFGVKVACKLMPLHQASWYLARNQKGRGDRFAALSQLAKLRPCGYLVTPRVALDADAQADAERQLQALEPDARPHVLFVGGRRQDIEGCFCEIDFLSKFFEAEIAAGSEASELPVRTHVLNALRNEDSKGSAVLYDLFDELLKERMSKATQLPRVARFLVDNKDELWAQPVIAALRVLMDFADATKPATSAPAT